MASVSPIGWLKRKFGRRKRLPEPDLHRLLNGYQTTALLYLAAKLKLPDQLAGGPRTSTELAAAQNLHAPALQRVLRGLAIIGVLAEDGESRFQLTPLGARLRSDTGNSEYHLAILNGEEYAVAWNDLLHSVRTGQTAFDHAFGQSPWEHRAAHPELNAVFNDWLKRGAAGTANSLAEAYDFSRYQRIADIGGNNGTLLAALLQKFPSARGILFDQPHVLATAREVMAGAGLASRCELLAGNFFESIPLAADICILKSVLHDWDDDQCLTILRHCHATLKAGQPLLLVEKILPVPSIVAPGVIMSDLHMMAVTGGRERTIAEYSSLLQRAGFALKQSAKLRSGHSLLESVRIEFA